VRAFSALSTVALAAILASGCGLNVPVSCEEVERDPPPPIGCDAAVDAARPQFAGLAGLTAVRFQYDECAPDAANCAFLFGTAGNVIAQFVDGRELAMFVTIDEDEAVRVQAPRPITPESQPSQVP